MSEEKLRYYNIPVVQGCPASNGLVGRGGITAYGLHQQGLHTMGAALVGVTRPTGYPPCMDGFFP